MFRVLGPDKCINMDVRIRVFYTHARKSIEQVRMYTFGFKMSGLGITRLHSFRLQDLGSKVFSE